MCKKRDTDRNRMLLHKLCAAFLVLCVTLLAGVRPAEAAEEAYTYTVRLYAGNQGILTKDGIEVGSDSASVSAKKDCIEVSGLKYGDTVYIRPQEAASVTDERYYVRGVRRSGRDNSEAEEPTFRVASDRDYVVAYGVSGDMVAYTVNYVDENGTALMKSDTYYGNIGERQYVSSRYIDGYQPQALNMVKTLSQNAAENVFTFRYTRITAPTAPTPPAQTPAGTGGNAPEAPGAAPADAGTGAAPADAGAGAAGAPAADAGADAGEAVPDAQVPLGGDAGVNLPDENVPLDQQQLEDLDDGEVPLSNLKEEKPTVMGYLPVYIGIGVAAAIILAGAVIYLGRRRKVLAAKAGKRGDDEPSGSGK